jgi:anti-anti-sigma factor
MVRSPAAPVLTGRRRIWSARPYVVGDSSRMETQVSKLHIAAEAPTVSLDGGTDVVVLVASGELDYDSAPLLRTTILSHIGAGKRRLVVDLSAVGFIDSMAIGVLVGTVARLRSSGGGALVVVCETRNKGVLRIFDVAGVANVISLYSSREEALRALVAAWMVELPSAAEPAFAGVLDDLPRITAVRPRPPAGAPR